MQPLFAVAILVLVAGLASITLALRAGRGWPNRRALALGGVLVACIAGAALAAPVALFWASVAAVGVTLIQAITRATRQATSRSAGPARSVVRTPWLEVWLDHDSGEMDGTVLAGDYAGQRLGTLDLDAVRRLMNEAAHDGDTLRLLEAWLDRNHADWRNREEPASSGPAREGDDGQMTRERALSVLGLIGEPDRQQIVDAHRRLMQQVHPDRGGSDYLAAEVNRAKDRLLEDLDDRP